MVAILLQIPATATTAAFAQVLPRPLVVLVEAMAIGGGRVVGGRRSVITTTHILLGGSVLGPE